MQPTIITMVDTPDSSRQGGGLSLLISKVDDDFKVRYAQKLWMYVQIIAQSTFMATRGLDT